MVGIRGCAEINYDCKDQDTIDGLLTYYAAHPDGPGKKVPTKLINYCVSCIKFQCKDGKDPGKLKEEPQRGKQPEKGKDAKDDGRSLAEPTPCESHPTQQDATVNDQKVVV
jgi:hypothetical protein